jgi:hypothetical protein
MENLLIAYDDDILKIGRWREKSRVVTKNEGVSICPSSGQDEETLFVTSSPHLLRIKGSIDR